MGRGDVARHCDSKGDTVHNKNVKSKCKISQFLVSTAPTKDQATINAEVLHANVIVPFYLYVLVMSRTHFRVNLHSIFASMSRNSLLETGAVWPNG